jgi:glyoxylase-like metal-dependent hydrolase (beta-lactamase superfamily II)
VIGFARRTARIGALAAALLGLACAGRSAPRTMGPVMRDAGTGQRDVYAVDAVRYATIPGVPLSALVAGGDTSKRVDIAMTVWLVRGTGRTVLVDAGFVRDDLVRRWHARDFESPAVAIGRAGVKPEQVTDVILTHGHWDHAGGAALFPNARIWIQQAEYEFYADSDKARRAGLDYTDSRILRDLYAKGRIQLVDGDAREILPGITVYLGGKHTVASQFVGVRSGTRTIVLASDNAYLYENLERRRPIAQTLDSLSNLRAQDRMHEIASGARLIVPGHDPEVFVRFPKPGNGVARIE